MTPVSVKSSRAGLVGMLVGLVLLAVNLRAAISGVSPLLDELQHTFGLSSAAMGVLTTLPVLSLGAFAAAAPPLARRVGAEATLVGALTLIATGIAVRLLPSAVALFAGTALAGAGIAMANVLMPYVIKRAFPHRVGSMTGLAMMLMSGGAALAAGLAVPLDGIGGWRLALAVWVVPALLAVAAWIPLARRTPNDHPPARRTPNDTPRIPPTPGNTPLTRPTPDSAPLARRTPDDAAQAAASPESDGESLLRNPLAWAITGFMGMQSLAFYVLMSWLPAVMKGQGFNAGTAGLMLSVMMTLGIPAGLVMPILAARTRDQRPLVVAVMTLMGLGTGGLLLAPSAGWLWVVILGIATGSAFPLAFTLITLRSAGPGVAARLSGMAQTAGYLLAGLGPLAFGVLHSVTGDWNVPLTVLLVWLVPETVIALRAARPAQIGTATPTIVEVPLPEPRQLATRH